MAHRLERRQQHSFVVAFGGGWCPGREHDLPAVDAEVGLEERDTETLRGLLRGAHHCVERVGQRLWTLLGEDLVDTRELDEPHGHATVFGYSPRAAHPLADTRRKQHLDGKAVDARGRHECIGANGGRTGDEEAVAEWPPHTRWVDERRGGSGDGDLVGTRGRLHVGASTGGGSAHDELTVHRRVTDEEGMELAGVDTGRHSQRRSGGTTPDATNLREPSAHAHHRVHCPGRMVGAVEQQHQRVATPLQ